MFEIFTDSASNLTLELMEKYDIHVISYTCFVDNEEFICFEKDRDNDKISKQFYDAMRDGSDVRTSLINTDVFINAFRPYMQEGKDVLFVGISSGISGTVQSAKIAAEMLKEEFSDRKCIVVDSVSASLGEGIQVCEASKLREQGATIEEVEEWYKKNTFKMRHIFTVGDLKYLKKGGRISATAAVAGTVLNLKPILKATNEGTIQLVEKVRGRKKALNTMVEDFKNHVVNPEIQTIGLAHCDCKEDAEYVAEKIRAFCKVKDIIITYYDLCTGSHVGPNTLALFYQGEYR
ncbi:MAG: DegV family protein [Eubacterium sp.]